MSSLTGFVFLHMFITTVHGLVPPSPNLAISVPSSSTSSTLDLLNLSSSANNLQHVNTTANENIKCDGKYWGYHLNKASCEEAWNKMPTDNQFVSFGARRMGHFERPLPYRYLSDDGLCAIDIDHMIKVVLDTATNHEISAAAKSILDKCVLRDEPKKQGNTPIGGYRNYIGRKKGLGISVSSYSPHVKCTLDSELEDETICTKLLGTMPINRSSYVFIREKTSGPRSVIIPWGGRKISSAPGTCTATIDFEEGDTDKSSWYEMWMAAVAVNEMCVTKGKAGAALGLGRDRTVMLSLSP